VLGILAAMILGPLALRIAVRRGARKQRAQFSEQLPSHLHDVASAMRAGRSLVGALDVVASNGDEPMKGELDRALADEQLGKPLEEALEGVSLRMQSPDMDQVTLVASLNRRTGSNVAEALDRVADGARERADLKREIQALTAQSKLSSRVLTVLPIALVLAMTAIAPQYAHPMTHTLGGIIVLCFSAGLVLAGWFVMRKITKVD
jgi:tight adherence protein B